MFANIVNLSEETKKLEFFKNMPMLGHVHFYSIDNYHNMDRNLPTLYVGFAFVSDIVPEVNILENHISEKVYWCFTQKEHGLFFVKVFREFMDKIPELIAIDHQYVRVDPFFETGLHPDTIFDEIIVDTAYKRNKCWYLYSDDIVYLIDLSLWEAVGVNTKDFELKVKTFSTRYHEDEEDKIYNYFVHRLQFNPESVERLIPYLIHLKNR